MSIHEFNHLEGNMFPGLIHHKLAECQAPKGDFIYLEHSCFKTILNTVLCPLDSDYRREENRDILTKNYHTHTTVNY
jgi:hypothetical protein